MVKAIIAEDEVILLKFLRKKLEKHWPELQVVAECYDGQSALDAIERHQPDVVFLDIQMNHFTGIDIANRIAKRTQIVFVTAYDKYAVNAFDVEATDYLMKPFSSDRLIQCIHRIQKRLNLPKEKTPNSIKLSIGNKSWMQPISEIKAVCAQGRYVEIICENRSALVRMPFKELIDLFDKEAFLQINRGVAVNINHLDYLKKPDSKHMHLYLHNFERPFVISRRFQSKFKSTIHV